MRKRVVEPWQNLIAELYPSKENQITAPQITFQVTSKCNLNCKYCYEHNKTAERMSLSTGKKIIDLILDMAEKDDPLAVVNKDTKGLSFDFIGGEPMLEAKLIEDILDYFIQEAARRRSPLLSRFRASICSNGQNFFTPEVQHLIKRFSKILSLNISIDGNKELHDLNRVDFNGKGSFDKAYKAFLTLPEEDRSTKMTFSPESLPHIFDSIKFMIENKVDYVAANYAFEPEYSYKDAKILYEQLKLIADYLIYSKPNVDVSMLDINLGEGVSEDQKSRNYCGGNGKMIAFAPDGTAYPCIRFAPISLGEKMSKVAEIGSASGLWITHSQKIFRDKLSAITLATQSTEDCIKCPIARGCGWCTGWNFEKLGDPNKRYTGICKVHQARVAGVYYYVNKRSLVLKDVPPKTVRIPKNWALNFMSQEEFNELKELEQKAFQAWNP